MTSQASEDGYFLSAENPIANADQRAVEDTAIRMIQHPDMQKARTTVSYLWREVVQHTDAAQLDRFDTMLDEFMFHQAMRAANADPNYPKISRFMTPPHRWFGRDVPGSRWAGDSPDFVYRIVSVGPGGRYELRGSPSCENPPTVNYAVMSDNPAAPVILGLLDSLDMTTEPDGSFVITLHSSAAEGRKNHIELRPGAYQIWIRDALGDWTTQSPNRLRIKRLNPPDRGPFTEEEILARAVKNAIDGFYYAYFCTRITTSLPPNQLFGPTTSGPMGGMATQLTCRSNVVLEADEAMIIVTTAAGAQFRNAVLQDVFMLSFEYWARTSSFNMDQMAPDADGRFTYVIAHQDPGIHNWLDTSGLRQTIWGQRWQAFSRTQPRETPTITAQIVKFHDLAATLQEGVRRIDAAGRRAQIAQRKAGFDGRFIDH